ncbi:hypothetical protein RSc1855 [Ralstonia pseudosolanacearum GMI1000]|uniref:Uncharacterized protein n=1 Tax=Ralstonia nicotianae (strain ATCC BAA-1114 / GMI1000) TaxID=267608 RepID=Q8XYA7_RALN1|nr:hypothetical protein RSc1855 [Ralstonia pseudosolanacearum GMI1000]
MIEIGYCKSGRRPKSISPSNEKNNDKQDKAGAAHARIQAGNGKAGQGMAAVEATPGVADQTTCKGAKPIGRGG